MNQRLQRLADQIQRELAVHSLKTRTTPRLRFHYDEVTARGNYMMDLISQAVIKTEQNEDEVDSKENDDS
jgi:ribosome-binding factor A